jgi:hypothetical protein
MNPTRGIVPTAVLEPPYTDKEHALAGLLSTQAPLSQMHPCMALPLARFVLGDPAVSALMQGDAAEGADCQERPEDTVRRFAHRLVCLQQIADAELERVRRTDDLSCKWWQRRRRQWADGVGVARACSEAALWEIKSAFYADGETPDAP